MTDELTPPLAPAVVKRRARRPDEVDAPADAAASTPDDSDAPAVRTPEVVVADVPPPQATPRSGSLDALLGGSPDLLGTDEQSGSALEAADLGAAEAVAAEMNEDFAAMFAASLNVGELKIGDRVRGTVVSIGEQEAYVDIGQKSEAVLNRRELLDSKGQLKVEVGQEIEAQVVFVGNEEVRLSYGALQAALLSEQLAEAAEHGLPVEGRVVAFNDGGLEVRFGTRRAFCPKSQVDRGMVNDLSGYVGKTFAFLVTRWDPTGRKIVVSRRTLLEQQAQSMAKETRATLEVGAIVEGRVRKVMPFGAFVDLGGVDGLIHVSEISWQRVEDPNEVLSEGQNVRVKILKLDGKKDRISLSMRAAQPDPWTGLKERFEPGQTYTGKVTRLTEFGAFVELEPGLEGLIHISEFDWTRRIKHPSDVVSEGESVSVVLVEIDKKRKRLALSIKQAQGDPWGDVIGDMKVGGKIEVTVEKVADFGVFAIIGEGVTGLIPKSQVKAPRGTVLGRAYKQGSKIQVQIMEIDRKRRKVTLSERALEEDGAKADFREYKKEMEKQRKAEESGGKSAMALALEAALGKG